MPIVAAGRFASILEQARNSHAEIRQVQLAKAESSAKSFRDVLAESLLGASIAFSGGAEPLPIPNEPLGSSHSFLDAILHSMVTSSRSMSATVPQNADESGSQRVEPMLKTEQSPHVETILNLLNEMTAYAADGELARRV